MKLFTSYKGMDWIIVATDHDYEPTVAGTWEGPGALESASITDGYVQLDSSGALVAKINKQLCERGNGSLFNMLIELDKDSITDQLLDKIHSKQDDDQMDYDVAAEELYQERRYEDFLNKEVGF